MTGTTSRSATLSAMLGLAGALTLLPGCPNSGDPAGDLVRSAGCKKDSQCTRVGEGLVCRKGSCVEASAPAAKAAAAPAPRPAPAGPVADLAVRICPGYWNLSQNSGTLIARNVSTGKKHYERLNAGLEEGALGTNFVFKGLPHSDYEVTYITGVIAGGQKDMMSVKCAVGTACRREVIRTVTLGPAPATEEARKQAADDLAALLKKQKLDSGPPCDFDVNL